MPRLARDFSHIEVHKKSNFWGYIFKRRIYLNPGEDSMVVLHRTRDHYKSVWGHGNVKLVLVWNKEELKF